MEIINLHYRFTNCYLLESNRGWIMIDTDWPDTLPQLLHSLKQQDIRMSDIKYQIVTHFHPDHAGLVQGLKNLGIQLIVHENQVSFIEKLNAFFKKNRKYNYKEIVGQDNIIVSSMESRRFLRDVGIDGEIIPTPGHSDDSISLIIDKCCAFTGDLPEISLLEAYNNQTLNESWKLIQDYQVTKIYPAHGNTYAIG